ncbi:LamG domain-containing protein [Candidatus Nanosalina sp. VS9-1]|uniref:LamG domain-containing protein n=1 Tax=Candidatus Nanosalina sp. VS9-1 TaxID=3388566 RepID=UPI0039DFD01D
MVLVGYWPLDEESGNTAYDVRGNNNGNVSGAIQGETGVVGGSSYHVNGDDGKLVDCGVLAEVHGSDSLSLSVWTKFESISSGFNSSIATHRDNDNGWGFTHNNGNEIRFRMENGATHASTNPATLSTGNWYHIAGVFNRDRSRLWIDGKLAAEPNQINNISVPSIDVPFKIGNNEYTNSGSRYIPLNACEIRVYDHALTPQEVQYLYQVGKRGLHTSDSRTL